VELTVGVVADSLSSTKESHELSEVSMDEGWRDKKEGAHLSVIAQSVTSLIIDSDGVDGKRSLVESDGECLE
jgi:hypothetical protein